MLNIVDINTNEKTLAEVTRLKEEFREQLSSVVNGSVVIISSFPAVGDMIGPLNYLIIISIPYAPGNYLKKKINGQEMYVNNAVIHIGAAEDDEVVSANDFTLQKSNGEFDYIPSVKAISNELRDYLMPYADIRLFGIYRLISGSAEKYHNEKLMLNYELSAKYLLWAICWQAVKDKKGKNVYSFPKNHPFTLNNEVMIAFARTVVSELDSRTKYGLLTKKKLDRITSSIKKVEEIYDNLGHTLSVISGKAGTGKTLMLTRIIHRHSREHKVARLITFNKLLVYDLIQTLRNFPQYNNLKLSVQTAHQFFYRQAQLLGITLILGEDRVKELLSVCEQRLENLRNVYDSFGRANGSFKNDEFRKAIAASSANPADNKEYLLFVNFLRWGPVKDFNSAKQQYLANKRKHLEHKIGHEMFLEDYNKVLEGIYLAVTDTDSFYTTYDIGGRYELLETLYRLDKDQEAGECHISPEEFAGQVARVKGSVNWSRLFLIDECQDFFIWEKEILYAIRGSENIIVASGGKEQLVRQNQLLDWTVSLGKKVPFVRFRLQDISYRQKQNIVQFVNAFGAAFGLPINLQSIGEQKGLGKVIIDCRKNTGFLLKPELALEFKLNGEINECSPYESLLIMLPAQGYTERKMQKGIHIDEMDVVQTTYTSVSRRTKGLEVMEEAGYFCWDGVTEDKAKLKVPNQTDTRIIHYESCRGLEAWTCALMSFDQFFDQKSEIEEAATHLSDDLFLSESERREKFATLWCLMALTRPIDSLYIHLENKKSKFSEKILNYARKQPGVLIMD